jgi:hypothetical protein
LHPKREPRKGGDAGAQEQTAAGGRSVLATSYPKQQCNSRLLASMFRWRGSVICFTLEGSFWPPCPDAIGPRTRLSRTDAMLRIRVRDHYAMRHPLLIYVALAVCVVLPAAASAKEHRSATVKHEFQTTHPCPSTGLTSGRCPGYVKDHIVPLTCGGPDVPSNMQWQTIRDARAKDKWETKGCAR